MERLNDIMTRTAQRHQQMQEQRPHQPGQDRPTTSAPLSAQPQRQRPKLPLTRRAALPEQTARLGQHFPVAPSQQPQNRQPQQMQQADQPVTNRGEQRSRYHQRRPSDHTLHQKDIDRRRSVYYQRPTQPAQQPPHEQEMRSSGYAVPSEPPLPRGASDYYETYPPLPPADVQEDWEEGMRYDDWEDEAQQSHLQQPSQRYAHTHIEASFVTPAASQDTSWPTSRSVPQQVSRPLVTRQLPRMVNQEPEMRSSMAYNVREVREVQVSQAQPPAAQPVPQEAQQYHRHTQPLDPRAIAGMQRDIHEQAQHTPYAQHGQYGQPTRHVVVHEQAQQHLPVLKSAPPAPAPKSVCPKCKGAGYLRIDVPFGHPNFGKPVACECKEAEKKEKRRQQLLELSDLTAFQNKSFQNFIRTGVHPTVQEALQEARKFAQDPAGWLVLIGPNGCGKTHLAAAIANQNLSGGAVVLFSVVPDLLAHLRSTFAPHATEAYDQRFSKMREAELLVLDDLGAHQSSPWASEKLFQLLNYRYNFGLPTVITANKSGLATLDERIQSRISDTALVTTVVMNGAVDYRRQNPRRELMR